MRRAARSCAIGLWLLLAACKSAKPSVGSETRPVKPAPVQEITAPVIAEQEVDSLLNRWRDAQNRGDFAAYEQLYASKFYGVKRVGTRAQRFDRAGWLGDRERMFKAPMVVEVREPKIHAAEGSVTVVFTQRWSSGAFEDLGQKRLLILLENGQLRIAQEEMLDSRPLPFSGKMRAAAEGFHFVVELKTGLYMVLNEAPPATAMSDGLLRREDRLGFDDPNLRAASRPLASIPPELESRKTWPVQLDDGCKARLVEFRLLVQVIHGYSDLSADDPEAVFALGTPAVVARLEGCAHGRYARPENAGPTIAAERFEDAALENEARVAYASLPIVAEMQQTYREFEPETQNLWWAEKLQIKLFRHPRSKNVLVYASAGLDGPCGGWNIGVVFERRGNKLHKLEEDYFANEVTDVFDLYGDGRLEIMHAGDGVTFERSLTFPHISGLRLDLKHDFIGCSC